ncbi:MAG: FtsW/RodA/SpoVE family cell cycle protein, partial [Myxococcota bacterium]|nr:FtsW/RodA/SpoVE family cell cycle protein [Myxococcota bacterium]
LLLIFPEPDFGTTLIIAGLCGVMMFIAGLRPAHIIFGLCAGIAAGIPLLLFEQYRVQRMVHFLDPWGDMNGEGYHVIQSWIAMHSGGLFGQGLGGSLAKLHFLPEPWTDFIASVLAEELGLVGLLSVIGLYSLLVWRGMYIARRARDPFGMLLAASLTTMIGLQAMFNLGVVMGVVPPKGLVLPFLSYGASALISHLWAVGILLSIASEADPKPIAEGWPRRKRKRSPRTAAAVS